MQEESFFREQRWAQPSTKVIKDATQANTKRGKDTLKKSYEK